LQSSQATHRLDYTSVPFSTDLSLLTQVGLKLAEIGRSIERAYEGVPQDIEGAITNEGRYYVVQTRAQI